MGEMGSWVRTAVVVGGLALTVNYVILPWIDTNTGDAAKVGAATAGAYGAGKGAASRLGGGGGGSGGGGRSASASKDKDKEKKKPPATNPPATTAAPRAKVIPRPVELIPTGTTLPVYLPGFNLDG